MWFSSDQSTKKKEMQKCISFFLVHFQGLLRPFGARAIASQWGEPTSENSDPFSSCPIVRMWFSSDQSTKKKRDAKMHLIFLGALSGATSPLGGSCRRKRRGEPTSENSDPFSSCPIVRMWFSSSKIQRKRGMQKHSSIFLVHFQGLEPWAH